LEAGVEGLNLKDVSLDTAAVSARLHFTGTRTEPLVPPIYHSSTYVLDNTEDFLGAIKDVCCMVAIIKGFMLYVVWGPIRIYVVCCMLYGWPLRMYMLYESVIISTYIFHKTGDFLRAIKDVCCRNL
jgi:hypothetical protein